jgi:hypothetical protein
MSSDWVTGVPRGGRAYGFPFQGGTVKWGREQGVAVKLALQLALFAAVGVLVCAVPAASTHTGQGQPCTSGVSSIRLGEPPVTTWYPPGCVHP